jgi:hypothetical protein
MEKIEAQRMRGHACLPLESGWLRIGVGIANNINRTNKHHPRAILLFFLSVLNDTINDIALFLPFQAFNFTDRE